MQQEFKDEQQQQLQHQKQLEVNLKQNLTNNISNNNNNNKIIYLDDKKNWHIINNNKNTKSMNSNSNSFSSSNDYYNINNNFDDTKNKLNKINLLNPSKINHDYNLNEFNSNIINSLSDSNETNVINNHNIKNIIYGADIIENNKNYLVKPQENKELKVTKFKQDNHNNNNYYNNNSKIVEEDSNSIETFNNNNFNNNNNNARYKSVVEFLVTNPDFENKNTINLNNNNKLNIKEQEQEQEKKEVIENEKSKQEYHNFNLINSFHQDKIETLYNLKDYSCKFNSNLGTNTSTDLFDCLLLDNCCKAKINNNNNNHHHHHHRNDNLGLNPNDLPSIKQNYKTTMSNSNTEPISISPLVTNQETTTTTTSTIIRKQTKTDNIVENEISSLNNLLNSDNCSIPEPILLINDQSKSDDINKFTNLKPIEISSNSLLSSNQSLKHSNTSANSTSRLITTTLDNSDKNDYSNILLLNNNNNNNFDDKIRLTTNNEDNTNNNNNNNQQFQNENKLDATTVFVRNQYEIKTRKHLLNNNNNENNNNNNFNETSSSSSYSYSYSLPKNQLTSLKQDTLFTANSNSSSSLNIKSNNNSILIKDDNNNNNNIRNIDLNSTDRIKSISINKLTDTIDSSNISNRIAKITNDINSSLLIDKNNTNTKSKEEQKRFIEIKDKTKEIYELKEQYQNQQHINDLLGKHFTQDLKELKDTIDKIDLSYSSESKEDKKPTHFMDYNNISNSTSNLNNCTNTTSRFTHSTTPVAMFHPTWDEWKRTHLNEKSKINNLNDSLSFKQHNINNNESFSNNKQNKYEFETRDYNNMLDNKLNINNESIESNKTTTRTHKNIVEEIYTHKSSHHNQEKNTKEYNNNNNQILQNPILIETNQNQMKQKYLEKKQDLYNPPSPIVINNSNKIEFLNSNRKDHQTHHQTFTNQTKSSITNTNTVSSSSSNARNQTNRSPRHYPVYPIDKQPQRAPSPVHLSSVVLAKEPPIEVKTQDEVIEPEPPQVEIQPPTKIKTIMSTQKRKESAPNLTGWRTESDSDTEIQNRLLAKASGSIPIEYISIRRDPKPSEKKPEKSKKSITTGTNTSVERGKRIAATNTDQDELPQYNLHLSLDSLFAKSKREASTSTERRNKNAATETEIKQKDAFTVTDVESEPEPPPPPPPPPQPEQYIYRSRKSRYTEWETASNPPETQYRLEFLTKSPRTLHRRNIQTSHQFHNSEHFTNYMNTNDDDTNFCDIPARRAFCEEIRVDDDDKLIFGCSHTSSLNQHYHEQFQNQQHVQEHQHHNFINRRSGSFPCLLMRPIITENAGGTRRYIKHTQTTSYTPQAPFIPLSQQYELSFMPLKQSIGHVNTDTWSQQFNQFNSKFNEIFGQKQTTYQPIEQGKTERFYKYSRTTCDNQQKQQQQQIPTFGEIFTRNNSFGSSGNFQQHHYQQQQQQQLQTQSFRSPIIEMPVTPPSTIGKRERFFSSSSNYASTAANQANSGVCSNSFGSYTQKNGSTSGIGGPVITTLSPNSSSANLFMGENKSGNNWFSTSSSSHMQRSSGFEPVVKKGMASSTTARTMSQSNNAFQSHSLVRGHGREEEEDELINIRNSPIDTDRQFRPIFQPNINDSYANSFGSTSATPIIVQNGRSANNSNSKQHNYSASSYEYSNQNITN